MVDKNKELLQQNPYSIQNFDYDMDDDVYFNEKGDVYSAADFERLQKEYEDNLQKQKEQESADSSKYDDLDETIYETRSEEEMAKLYAGENQLKLKESMEEDIEEINIKGEKALRAGGDPVPEPKYIGWDQAFTARQKDDSEKMADIRSALDHYHKVKGSVYEGDALRSLITRCNTYTWMKVPFLKFGKAKERLNEVKALRARAMEELEQSPYKNNILKTEEKTEEKRETNNDFMIYNEREKYDDKVRNSATVGQKIAGGLAALFGTLVLTPLKIATYPLKAMAYGVDKLYRYVEKKFDVMDTRRELDMSIKGWKPTRYYFDTLMAMNRPFFTTSTDKKIKELSEKDDESLYDTSAETLELEDAENDALELLEFKEKLKAEYEKKNPDPKEIERLRDEIEMLQDSVDTYLEDNPDATLSMEDHAPIDAWLAKAKMVYDGKLKADEMAVEYREKSIATQREIQYKTQTKEGKEEFKNEMHRLAMDNIHIRIDNGDLDCDKRDEAYDEKKLFEMLDDFEALDIKEINFFNHVDMLRDYEKNMTFFEQSRAVHYQLMRGLNRGLKLDDERLIRLRAKFTAMFEMQEYLVELNRRVATAGLDLSGDPEEIRESIFKELNKKLVDRYPVILGDNDAFLTSCEEKIREQYNNRKKTIKKMHGLLVRGGADEKIPKELLEKKMEAYETNEIVYDYIHRTSMRFMQDKWSVKVKIFNEENGTGFQSAGISRFHGNFMWGKTDEDIIGLTGMATQKGYPKLDYIKAVLTEMKSIDYKEFDHKDMGKFYDDFNRKERVLQLWNNATDLPGIMQQALKEIREEENKDRAERGEEPNTAPLELPDMFKEMGYVDLEDFKIDMTVIQDVGNMIAGHYDAIVQTTSHGNLSYFSLQELGMLDGKQSEDIEKSVDAYKKRLARKGISEDDDEIENDQAFKTADYIKGATDFYNAPIPTRELSKKQKEANKKNEDAGNTEAIIRQERMTIKVNVETIYREEKQKHYLKRIRDARKPQTKEQLLAEKEKAEPFVTKQVEIHDGRTGLLQKNGYDKNPEYRSLRAYAGDLSYLCGDSEEKSLERVKALSVKPKEATSEQKQAMAKELESVFKVLMDFDLKELNFNSISDVLDEAHERAATMVRFCFSGAKLFDYYEELIKDEGTETLLDEEEYQEIMTKKDFLLRIEPLFVGVPIQMTKPMHQIMDSISLLGLSDKEFDDYSEEIKDEESLKKLAKELPDIKDPYVLISEIDTFLNNVDRIRRTLHENMLYPGMNMEEVYRATTTKLNGLGAGEVAQRIKEKLA